MTMIESPTMQPVPRDQRELESAVEGALGAYLYGERDRYVEALAERGLDVEVATLVLDDFITWSEQSRLPSSACALAYYMLALHRDGADVTELRNIAQSFVVRLDWDNRLPLCAALNYIEATPRVAQPHAALH
jgi:hypothetical protein